MLDELYPADRAYTAQHLWVLNEEGTWRVGITRHSYGALDAIIGLELPEVDERLEAGELIGFVQSLVGAMQELYAPASGVVCELNDEIVDDPEVLFVDDDPYGDGWLIRMVPDDPSAYAALLDRDDYVERGGVSID